MNGSREEAKGDILSMLQHIRQNQLGSPLRTITSVRLLVIWLAVMEGGGKRLHLHHA